MPVRMDFINWSNSVDYFSANADPGSPVLGEIVIDGNPGASWNPSDGTITPTAPVPEPSTYGAMLIGGSLAWLLWRRRVRTKRAEIAAARAAKMDLPEIASAKEDAAEVDSAKIDSAEVEPALRAG